MIFMIGADLLCPASQVACDAGYILDPTKLEEGGTKDDCCVKSWDLFTCHWDHGATTSLGFGFSVGDGCPRRSHGCKGRFTSGWIQEDPGWVAATHGHWKYSDYRV